MIYIILFAAFAMLGFLDFTSVNKNTKLFWYISGVSVLIFLGSVRWRTGSDWSAYASYFARNDTWEHFRKAGFEIGYAFITFLVKTNIANFTVFLTVFSFLTIGLKAYTFHYHTTYFLIALLGYFCFFMGDISTVRQSLAISLCLISVGSIINKKPISFICIILISFTIHNSSIVFLLAYWVYNWRLSNKTIILLIVGSIIIGVSGVLTKILTPLNFLFETIGGETAARMSSKLDVYAKNKDIGATLSHGTILLVGILRRSFFIPIYLIFRSRSQNTDERYDGFLNLFIFGNLCYFIFASSILELVRATIFYIAFEIFLICILVQSFKSLKVKIFVYWLVILYCGLKLYYNLYAYWDLMVPFNTIFDSDIQRVTY